MKYRLFDVGNTTILAAGGDCEVETETVISNDIEEPRQYEVVLLNDDYTTMDFVIDVLMRFFRKTAGEAEYIMLQVHQNGSGVCGIYPHDIAETKVGQVIDYARSNGHPLMCVMRPH